MPVTEKGIAHRIGLIVEAAGSARRFAEIVGVQGPTVLGWVGGSVPFPRNLRHICEVTGIALEWLEHGRGNTEEQLGIFRERTLNVAPRKRFQDGNDSASSIVAKEPPNHPPMSEDPMSWDRILDHITHRLPADAVAQMLSSVLAARDIAPHVKHRAASRLSEIVGKRIASENHSQKHN